MKKYIYPIITFCLFLLNTFLVIIDQMSHVDSYFHNLLFKDNMPYLNNFMKLFTFFGSSLFVIFLVIVLIFVFLKKNKKISFDIAALIIISTVLNNIIKLIVGRPRPEYITVVERTLSYPSGHTMACVTLYGFLIYFIIKSNLSNKSKKIFSSFFFSLILIIMCSRIYLGAHYFSDVFGGFLLSITILLLYIFKQEKKL